MSGEDKHDVSASPSDHDTQGGRRQSAGPVPVEGAAGVIPGRRQLKRET
jgi:hypothetical protein